MDHSQWSLSNFDEVIPLRGSSSPIIQNPSEPRLGREPFVTHKKQTSNNINDED
jgi:hypothetical protein